MIDHFRSNISDIMDSIAPTKLKVVFGKMEGKRGGSKRFTNLPVSVESELNSSRVQMNRASSLLRKH